MADDKDRRDGIPKLQKLFDRPFVLLVVGTVVMVVFYTLWGIVDMQSLPQATLP